LLLTFLPLIIVPFHLISLQCDNKFIVCKMRDADGGYSVILIDQHAADERVQLETLQRELLGVAEAPDVSDAAGAVGVGEGGGAPAASTSVATATATATATAAPAAAAASAAAGLLTTTARIRSVSLSPPLVMTVSKEEALMLSQFRDKMARWGVQYLLLGDDAVGQVRHIGDVGSRLKVRSLFVLCLFVCEAGTMCI
jgi:hypothetical protein